MNRSVLPYIALALSVRQAAAASWPMQSFMTEEFSAPRMSMEKMGETAPGLLFICPIRIEDNAIAPMIMQQDGQLVWRSDKHKAAYNVDRQELHGEPVLTYWQGHHDEKGYGCGWGGVDIYDQTYTRLHRVCGNKLDINPFTPQPCLLDTHESRITSRGTILVTARSVIPADLTSVGGPKDGWVLDSLFYELDPATEEVILRWSTYEHVSDKFPFLKLSHYPLEMASGDGRFGHSKHLPWDFAHMNSISEVPSPGEGFIISCRYLWSAIKINRKGDVEWYLEGSNGGDFDLDPSGNFSFQHDIISSAVTTHSMDIHMFDNANDEHTHPQRPSSGLLLRMNLASKRVETLQRFSPRNVTSSQKTGSYQALPWKNHVLVDFGAPPILNEFDSNGNVVWAASVADLGSGTYRAYKKSWTGYPKTKPKVVAQYGASDSDPASTDVWASWNGATEVDRWEIYGRRTPQDPVIYLATFPKAGFETLVRMFEKYSQVQVMAMMSNGTVLGTSDMSEVKQHSGAASLSSRSSLVALAVSIVVMMLY